MSAGSITWVEALEQRVRNVLAAERPRWAAYAAG